jgi:hypothetical protein
MSTRRLRLSLALVVTVLVGAAGPAAEAQEACAATRIEGARRRARLAMEAGEPRRAATILETIDRGCIEPRPWDAAAGAEELERWLWAHSDRAFALYRSGDPVSCLRVTVSQTLGRQFSREEATRAERAIHHNEELCRRAREAMLADFRTTPCESERSDPMVRVPRRRGDAGRRWCLALRGDREELAAARWGTEDPSKICPAFVAFVGGRGRGGKLSRRGTLAAAEGPLGDPSRCCNVERFSVAVRRADVLVRVQGEGRDCYGGTAYDIVDALYRWKDRRLELVSDDSI